MNLVIPVFFILSSILWQRKHNRKEVFLWSLQEVIDIDILSACFQTSMDNTKSQSTRKSLQLETLGLAYLNFPRESELAASNRGISSAGCSKTDHNAEMTPSEGDAGCWAEY